MTDEERKELQASMEEKLKTIYDWKRTYIKINQP